MTVGRLVEGRSNDLGINAACHVGNLLGSLVDEQDNHVGVGMVLRYRVGNILEQYSLTCLGRSHDESTLPLANGRKHVDDASRDVGASVVNEVELLVGEQWHQMLERNAVANELWSSPID